MEKLVKTEWIKLRYNRILGLIIIVFIFISFILADASFKKLPEWLSSTPGFMNHMEMSRGEFVYRRVMSDSSLPAWLSVFFAALFIGSEFTNRCMNQEIFAGNSRLHIFVVKAVEFYLAGILVASIYPVVSCLKYSSAWLFSLRGQDAADLWWHILMKVVLDMGVMSISLMAVFLFRDIVRSMAATFVFTIVLSRILSISASLPEGSVLYKVLKLYPASQYTEVMNPEASGGQLGIAMVAALTLIVFSGVVSFILFYRAELS